MFRVWDQTRILDSQLLIPAVLNHVQRICHVGVSPVTCDYNNTNFPKMKCTFCTNYSQWFPVKTQFSTQDF